jgi:hypothetical protein
VVANRRTGAETLRRLRQVFAEFLPVSMADITQGRVERWRTVTSPIIRITPSVDSVLLQPLGHLSASTRRLAHGRPREWGQQSSVNGGMPSKRP